MNPCLNLFACHFKRDSVCTMSKESVNGLNVNVFTPLEAIVTTRTTLTWEKRGAKRQIEPKRTTSSNVILSVTLMT